MLRCRATEVSAREGVCPSLAGASKLNAPRFALYHRWPCEAHAQASHQSFSRVASPLPMPPAISTRRLGRISCKSLEPPLGSAIAFRRSGELPASLLQVSGTPSLEPPLGGRGYLPCRDLVAASLRRREVCPRGSDCPAELTDSNFPPPLRRLARADVCLRRAKVAALTGDCPSKIVCARATGGRCQGTSGSPAPRAVGQSRRGPIDAHACCSGCPKIVLVRFPPDQLRSTGWLHSEDHTEDSTWINAHAP